ncbi:hypothetical protein M0R04_11680 [Candidatus Dojkabacteria bacterium]|nr:hypothetical protein [Candidatus Dojkabacteria bacterium]
MINILFIWLLILIATVFVAIESRAGELNKLDISYGKSMGTNRDFTYTERKKGDLNLHFNYSILNRIDLDTNILSKFTASQFRYIELAPQLNLKINGQFKLFINHRSGHALDTQYVTKYPNENSVGVNFTLYEK